MHLSLVSHPWTVGLVAQVDIMSEALVGGYSCREHVCESLPGKRGECLHQQQSGNSFLWTVFLACIFLQLCAMLLLQLPLSPSGVAFAPWS